MRSKEEPYRRLELGLFKQLDINVKREVLESLLHSISDYSNCLNEEVMSVLETTLRGSDDELRKQAGHCLSEIITHSYKFKDRGLYILIEASCDPDQSVKEVALQELYKHADDYHCYPGGPDHEDEFFKRKDDHPSGHGRNFYKCKVCSHEWYRWDDE